MPATRGKLRFSVQAKVLLVVLGFLVLLPVMVVWIVDERLTGQMHEEARQTLETAEAVFRKSLDARGANFLLRYQSLANEVRFKVTAGLTAGPIADRKTMERLLRDVKTDSPGEHEEFLFSTRADGLVAADFRETAPTPAVFGRAAESITEAAFTGGPLTGILGIEGKVYNVIAVPVTNDQGAPVGALTVGVRLGADAFRELRLPRTEVLLLIGGQIAASSFDASERGESVLQQLAVAERTPTAADRIFSAEAGGEHFLALAGGYGPRGAQAGFRYVLLSSYEPRLRALENTRRTLLELSIGGILLSVLAVSFFVRRITQPLRELRDGAEAVGRGDFSRRIARLPNDECGDLAVAFNGMTDNLQSSRAELEKTVDTLKATQAQLIQSEKLSAVGQFVAGVAHELNNPLTSVIGFSELLSQTDTNEKIRPHLQLIAKSAHRCHKIVQSLLSFSRQHAPERRLIQLGSVVDDVLEIMAYDLRTSNVEIVRDIPDGLPPILGDPHQLQQVFVNILGNARQALEPFRRDGQIVIRARVDAGVMRLEFQDNGPGIRPENVSRIFDPFFTTKPVGKGTGLGLSLSYGLIQEHGGKIRVQSEPGYGAMFIIELPVATTPPAVLLGTAAAPSRESRSPFATSGEGKAVLIVEDEEWIITLTEELLRQEGYRVMSAVNGEKALAAMQRVKFDVIVCDWKMPGMNGIQLYEHLLQHDPAAAKRMLFMTGDVVNSTFEDFLRRHGKSYLTKPFAIEEFREAVAAMVKSGM